ncbi:MAG: hypothetical protein MR376_06280 [Campylobacter lanienae]|uniref:hypothetical protein n=1 Tax=Campylobacter lanienae TaxID=75658 RepID=UPI00242E6E6B|nr:hypothetical protein [Campylobacter lanienae]MCI5540154.1 hypothetical protein [Campylobacter lanienae]
MLKKKGGGGSQGATIFRSVANDDLHRFAVTLLICQKALPFPLKKERKIYISLIFQKFYIIKKEK